MNDKQLSRRAFLQQSGAVLAGAAAAGAISMLAHAAEGPAGAKVSWPMRLSTSTVQFSTLSVEKACERIAELGFVGVDFWPAGFGCPHLDEIEKRLASTPSACRPT